MADKTTDKQQAKQPGDRPVARTEPEAWADKPAGERDRFPAAADPHGAPPETAVPGPREHLADSRTQGEREEAARLSKEAADDPIDAQGRNLLAVFDPQGVAKGLRIPLSDAERLVDVLLVRLGRGNAEARAGRLVKALARVSRGDAVDDVLRDAGREAGADQPRVERADDVLKSAGAT